MAIRPIIYPDNPILRKRAYKVTNIADPVLQTLIDDMIETLIDAPGVGLAAPQVAVSQRVIVVRLPDDEESKEEYGDQAGILYVVINPEIVRESRETIDGIEACLSIPGYYGEVERKTAVTVRGVDRNGKEIRIKAKDWLARVFQHEIDHLDGVLYIDHAKRMWRVREDEEYDEEISLRSEPAEVESGE
ncbi:MAG TPA: peptide deformylase [Aggregatilinea sp.]|jgi:peptide deformylase|uniref:peptide deformylase n=1 Tax=Aggregatilinea sp. TaxID=2806333 RepID=UPI002B5A8677|nr:peptide deformylase [Aggregatilinea sp.]HML21279.1 peptide deformylase [Aggregatilinea sp.]